MSTSTGASEQAVNTNEEAIRAWDGPLYERFVRFRETVTMGLGSHGEEALRPASALARAASD